MRLEKLVGKKALVTGVSGGVGGEIAKIFLNNGIEVTALVRKLSDADIILQKLSPKDRNLLKFSVVDLSSLKDLNELLNAGPINADILVNAAGIFTKGSIENNQITDFLTAINVNLLASWVLTKLVVNSMKNNRWGRIINIGSSSAYSGFNSTSIYCSTKHALLGFSRSMHSELRAYGIRTIFIAPGSIKTRMGELVEGQDYSTFIDPTDVADMVLDLVKINGNMVIDEIRLNRMEYK